MLTIVIHILVAVFQARKCEVKMKFRNLDNDHDWKFGKGLNDYRRDEEAVKLNIRTRILSWFGDCFFAQTEGIDWINRLGKTNQRTLLEQDLKSIILKTPEVAELISFSTSLVNREFTAEYSIRTIYSRTFKDEIKQVV